MVDLIIPVTDPKEPGERYPVAINYFGKTPGGVRPISGTATAQNITDDTPANDFLQSEDVVVSGWNILVGLVGGIAGKDYHVKGPITFSDGSVLNFEFIVPVREPQEPPA